MTDLLIAQEHAAIVQNLGLQVHDRYTELKIIGIDLPDPDGGDKVI